MGRLLNWVFGSCAALSLVLGMLVLVMWLRSYRVGDGVYVRVGTALAGAASSGGQIQLEWIPGLGSIGGEGYRRYDPRVTRTLRDHFTFRFDRASFGAGNPPQMFDNYSVVLPHWILVLVLSLPAAVWWLRWSRSRRTRREGRCVTCGYDLRATPDRCPECGTIPHRDSSTPPGDPP